MHPAVALSKFNRVNPNPQSSQLNSLSETKKYTRTVYSKNTYMKKEQKEKKISRKF